MIEHQAITNIDVSSEIQTLRLEIQKLKDHNQTQVMSQPDAPIKEEKRSEPQVGREPLVTIVDVERILHQSDKQKKESLLAAWHKLEQFDEPGKELSAHLLFEGELEAVSEKEMLLVYDDVATATQMYDQDIKNDVLEILNSKSKVIENYAVILKSDWLSIKAEYVTLWKQGHTEPKLTNRDLQLYKKSNHIKTDEVYDIAKEYFGDKATKKGN